MLGKAFRPPQQLPDRAFADLAASLCVTCNWGEVGAVGSRSLDDTLLASCAQRTPSAFGALGAGAINAVAFSLWCVAAQSLSEGAVTCAKGAGD